MNSKEIREKWLKFFESKNHMIVPSKSLVPQNDPSLLWINSGVATLKDYFSGKKIAPSKRLTNSQKAIRTNDIENVGITARHHTFFEMLGNFSIGDYFKKEAIDFAYEFLTEVLKLDKEKLYFTYYFEDLETKQMWMSHGVSEEHMIPGTKDTNFWEVGAGPCGPNTEIFYDRGEKYDSRGIELLQKDLENDRYIEIWNIVFSTYNSNGEGEYTELKQKNIDTGAGLERIVSIMQDAPTNFDTDLFLPIIHEIEKYTSYRYEINNYFVNDPKQTEINSCFKVIADHMRTVVNAIADGAKPSNVGRGYILRRLIRRSVYKAMQLEIFEPFLYKLVEVVKERLPFEYDSAPIAKIIHDEELTFSKTIENGKEILNSYLTDSDSKFPGDLAFKLFETYGFPVELTSEILAQKGIQIDLEGFELAREKHSEASRNSKVSGMDKVINSLTLIKAKVDEFIGYEYTHNQTKILYLLDTEKEISEANGVSFAILEKTPFYATSGGQKHDRGYLLQNGNKIIILDVFKDKFGNHIHKLEGKINSTDLVECFVDEKIRLGLERNHSGTHLLFSALRTILGPQIKQLGSDNNEERLTFDLPADTKPSDEQIANIENLVREYIKKDASRSYLNMTTKQAQDMGAIMTLEEAEYMDPNSVRIVKFDGITADLCGGTHLSNTAKLENFKITNVEKKAAGVYRIRAISSNEIVDEFLENETDKLLIEVNRAIEKNEKVDSNYKFDLEIPSDKELALSYLKMVLEKLKEDNKALNKQKLNSFEFDYDEVDFLNIKNHQVYLNFNLDSQHIKTVASTLREKYSNAIIICLSTGNNPLLVVASKEINSNTLAQKIFTKFNGRGGGNAILSMGKLANSLQEQEILNFLENDLEWENLV
ncbi:alanine--tRNA ligase [Mycoplasmopsis gallopavonis]|uniref:Alanine--tRNA ligase n=1 Tax=Mycoplasmopsis gallopavonis TaxID=76629 RepID=A0A449AZA7_9BACT|nr:alanine--tRNA ligase [Mycoplasmopsis gallopavonis]RIV16442.1 alanine--tRNA ligase [Mycoplasmopsis gallopavonis]VEU72831.1 Alanine--tRNA ligase [Mycoplasmopsis gallopavonis]